MSSQDFLQTRSLAAEPKMIQVADDEPVVLRILHVGTGTTQTPTVVISDTSSTLTLTDGDGTELELDLSAAAYNTVGEVADAINANASWMCKVLDALRSDASNDVWPNGAVTAATKEGETVFDITSDTSALTKYRLRVTYDRAVNATRPSNGHRVILKTINYNIDLTAAADGVKVYEITGSNGQTETQVLSRLSVDATDTEIDFGDGTTPGEGNDYVIAIDGTVVDAGANYLQAQYTRE